MAAPVYQRAFSQDINEPVFVRHCGGMMFTGDALSDTISVEMYDEDAPYSMSGTVVCNCIRADGATVPVTGSVSGNRAQATLVANCFAIPGPLAVVMQITSGSTTTTLLKAMYTVDVSATGTTIDPGNVITDVNALISAIETAIGSIPSDYSGLLATVASDFSSSTSYAVGDYVWYDGDLYRFKTAHSGTWSSSDVDAVTVGQELKDTLHFMRILTSSDAVDDIVATGMYRWNASSLPQNLPIASGAGHLIVGGKGAGRFQMVILQNGEVKSRYRFNNGTYTDWEGLALKKYIAPDFDATVSYTAGQYVFYKGILYRFIANHSAGAWNASHVDPAAVGTSLRVNTETSNANKAAIASTFSGTPTYAVGDYVWYDGGLYRFKKEHTGAWSSSDVDAVTIGGELTDSLHFMRILTSSDDVDNIIETGIYRWATTSIPQNLPIISGAGELIVGGKGTRFQLLILANGEVKSRLRYSDGTFTDWEGLALKKYIAPDFDATVSYTAGQYVFYKGILYRFIANHSAGAWNASHVDPAAVGTSLRVNTETSNANKAAIAPTFSGTPTYAVGDYVWYDGGLYRFKKEHTGAWSSSDVDAVTIGGELTDSLHYMRILDSNDDLDNIIETGVYRWQAENVPVNAPVVATGGHLIVGGKGVRWQIAISYARTIYARIRLSDGTYNDWVATANKLGTLDHTVALTDADDLDALDSTGLYQYFSSSVPDNAPDSVGAVLICAKYDSTYCVQAALNARGSVYTRMHVSGGWTSWQDTIYPKDRIHINAVKGAWNKNGVILTGGVKGVCNDTLLTCVPGSALNFYLDPHWSYTIREGLSATNLSVRTAHLSKNARHIVTYPYVALMFNKWDENDEDTITITAADFDQNVIVHTSGSAVDNTAISTDIHDSPESGGVLNVISRAYQMSKIRYTALATLPMHKGGSMSPTIADAAAGTDIQGIVYSSMRETMASVPQATSFHTWMTALLNPNSYVYTRHYEQNADHASDPSYEHNYNSRNFYGAVCSTLVAYCYGIENAMPTTIAFDTYPGFEALPAENQNPYSLKLGDSLNKSGDHIVIITDIIRNYLGRIKSIEITEANKPLCRSRTYTPAEIVSEYFDKGFVAFRYANIDSVTYTPSPWVHVDDTETAEPTYSEQLSPRKGDKANWSGENVVIDVMSSGDHTGYSVTNRDTHTVVASGSIPSGNVITLSSLAAGRYECTLTGGTSSVTPVYFNVLSSSTTYSLGTNKVTVSGWSLSGDPTATPTAIYWCGSVCSKSDFKAVAAFHVLTAGEISAGTVTLDKPELGNKEENYSADGKTWLLRMQWKTEFGLYATPLTTVTLT